jgi:hypothetical protein
MKIIVRLPQGMGVEKGFLPELQVKLTYPKIQPHRGTTPQAKG